MLIASVVASLEFYRQLSTAGHRDVARARLARALFDRISDDVRSVTFTPDEDAGNAIGDDDVGAAEEETDEEEVVELESFDTEAAYATGSVGIAGDAVTLVIHTHQSERFEATAEFTLPELLEYGGRTGDQRSVSYFVAQVGRPGLVGVVADKLLERSTDPNLPRDEPLGLVRLEGDRLSMSLADDAGDYEYLAGGATLIAPEVKTIAVRYFDGSQWWSTWDSETYNTLPRAVEVTLGIRLDPTAPRPRRRGSVREESPANVVEHRFVIALPQADPTPLEEF